MLHQPKKQAVGRPTAAFAFCAVAFLHSSVRPIPATGGCSGSTPHRSPRQQRSPRSSRDLLQKTQWEEVSSSSASHGEKRGSFDEHQESADFEQNREDGKECLVCGSTSRSRRTLEGCGRVHFLIGTVRSLGVDDLMPCPLSLSTEQGLLIFVLKQRGGIFVLRCGGNRARCKREGLSQARKRRR